ncbi:MAG: AsmA family protein [Pseudomonadota bacterium]|nr:AsmA family protein [Pseudomonadota bacterium]
MQTKKIISVIIKTVAIPVVLIALLIAILFYAEISLPLESVRQQFIKKATEITGQEVRINGEVRLAISFYPTLVVDQLHIANEPGWSAGDILSVGEARVQLALLPIFSGQLEFLEVSASSVQINLEQASDGRQNWVSFIRTESKAESEPSVPGNVSNDEKKLWIEEFRLTDLNLYYIDESLGREFTNHIDSLVINTHDKSYLTASLEGASKETPYSFTAKSDLLRNLTSNKPWELELQGQVADKPVNIEVALKHTFPTLVGTVKLDAQEVDIGKTLSWLGLVEGLDAHSSDLTFNANLHGSNLKEILEQSVFKLDLADGHWKLHNPANDKSRKITFSTATQIAEPGKPVKLEFMGKIDDEPAQLELSSNRMSEFFTNLEKVHLDLTATLEHSKIKLTGDIDLPISQQSLIVDLEVKGKRLNQWSKLLETDIPPFGPYHFSGKFSVDSKGFRVRNLKTIIGDSDLGGQIFVDTSGNKTHWDLNLASQSFQINDFEVEGFSLFPKTDPTASTARDRKYNVKLVQQGLNEGFKESRDYPNIDVSLQLEARRVLSGQDDLGSGKLNLHARENSLSVDTFKLDVPGGSIAGALDLQQHEENFEGRLKLNMDKFDYGILYRRFWPDHSADGLISTRVDLQLSGRDLKHALDQANGQLDFALWPRNIDASAINLWSVNLFLAILPELNKKESKFNCGTVLLDIKDGQLSEELLFIDSSKIWMKGNLKVDFPEKEVSLVLFPTAKKAKLFGLQAPMRIKGTFSDLRVSIKPMDIVGAYFKFITSPLHAPFRRAFGKHTEEDLSEFCDELLDREYLRSLVEEMEKRTPTLDEMYDNF